MKTNGQHGVEFGDRMPVAVRDRTRLRGLGLSNCYRITPQFFELALA